MKWFAKCGASALVFAMSAFVWSGCAVDVDAGDELEAAELGEAVETDDQELAIGDGDTSNATCNQCSNCVLYARCRQPKLPFGLNTYQDKLNIINTQTAAAGYVAVINSGSSAGHVAYVTSVSGSTIHIAEGNWPNGSCGTRSGTKAGLKIQGYFRP
ncbi:CHAP domain-containing protein [Chondromyces crocatus]|uniref:Peptidase C51 domain-containing protein n=1 Tax=Chondromyces crocatus TaxID=52 RepID=A0A0K1EIF9_CHOCO|nr:CHAP domain-containing protein [Chondromyces crocatus]AKT40640.1 uncharacterized protein CMC5_047960 [Chondromyces crocatus]